MNVYTNYPKQCPENPLYLPLNARRAYLTHSWNVSARVIQQNVLEKEQHKISDFFTLTECLLTISSAILKIKIGLNNLSQEEQVRSFTKLDGLVERQKKKFIDLAVKAVPIGSKFTYDKILKVILKWMQSIEEENPQVLYLPKFSFENFAVNKAPMHTLCTYYQPVCFDYAFYKLNEVHAFPFMKHETYIWPDELFSDPQTYLGKWGYQITTKPSGGDLVVYCSTQGGSFKAAHWGVWTSDERVLSKGGVFNPTIHPIADVILSYGNFVYFFHKEIKSVYLKECLNIIETGVNSVEDFSHPATYSPLTTKGSINFLIPLFFEIPFKDILRDSIFNIDYNNRIKSQFAKACCEYFTTDFSTITKTEVFNTLSDIAYKTSKSITVKV